MDTIKKNRIEIMKKAYIMLSLKEEIGENLMKIYNELDKEIDKGIFLVKENEWVKFGNLSKNVSEVNFLKNEILINDFNSFVKKIESRIK